MDTITISMHPSISALAFVLLSTAWSDALITTSELKAASVILGITSSSKCENYQIHSVEGGEVGGCSTLPIPSTGTSTAMTAKNTADAIQSRHKFLSHTFISLTMMAVSVVVTPHSAVSLDNNTTSHFDSFVSYTTQPGSSTNIAQHTMDHPQIDGWAIVGQASKKALGGGKAGALAAVVQVCSLMWLRTSMNYQYRYGGNLQSSLRDLWADGGLPRLYQGLPLALIQGPLSRFGDTAANIGVLALLDAIDTTHDLPLPVV
jgi:hypothetical protein